MTEQTAELERNDYGQTFKLWMILVNKNLAERTGVTADDLPDHCYWDMWADQYTVEEAASEVLEENGFPYG